ncbi:MAG: class I SAM-dependent methyltransferase [Gammaproteobacteria bacterium]|nr:class I SAM-dependent methyltransferase [Gammaproteobacteria bacterium]MBU1655964.1 class I SAM-dependent methyltransferase [Gammaproteobacteria bacterium]MBU1962476.1 class I SAM-dependent methyltransferase [Gammaproteobacteria bacterium]
MSAADSYDAIPYESTTLPDTHPGHLACLARLYGVDSVPPTSCKVLEFGCASGGNLIPMAARLPDSYFLGIELSPNQAQEGASRIAELGLKNCEIKQANLLDLQDEGMRFDYIITHGVYSWSPPLVRARIMELSSQLLSPKGVAYISYNSYPGWRMRGMLRDMLLYQVRDIQSPLAKLEAAQNYLHFLDEASEGLEAAHIDYLKVEIDRIRKSHPSYLYHEYLETYNEPILLQDFIREANSQGLDYICDIDLALVFPGYLGERAESLLSPIRDPIERLQQVDFLLNRNFHQSLLCHKALQPSRIPDFEQLRGFAWIADLRPPRKLDLRRNKPAPFMHQEGQKHDVAHPLTKAGIALLAERFPTPVPFTELLGRAAKWVRSDGGDFFAGQEDEMLNEMFALYAMGIIHARPMDMLNTTIGLKEWQMEAVVRQGISRGDSHIPTIHHVSINLDPFAVRVIRYLDGNTDKNKLLQMLLEDFKPGGDLVGLVDSNMPAEKLASHLEYHLEQLLALFRKHAVLG